jgi:nicotinamidase-related amidase
MTTALLVIDAQNYFINDYTKNIPRHIRDFMQKRKFDFVVFFRFINSEDSSVVKFMNWRKMFSPPDTDIVPELIEFANSNKVFSKGSYSAFKSPEFREFLSKNNVNKLFLCGFDTDCCILTTALEAFDLGYETKVLGDLCSSHHGLSYHNDAIKIMEKNAKGIVIESAKC